MTGNAVIDIAAAMNSANGQNARLRAQAVGYSRAAIARPSAIGTQHRRARRSSRRRQSARARPCGTRSSAPTMNMNSTRPELRQRRRAPAATAFANTCACSSGRQRAEHDRGRARCRPPFRRSPTAGRSSAAPGPARARSRGSPRAAAAAASACSDQAAVGRSNRQRVRLRAGRRAGSRSASSAIAQPHRPADGRAGARARFRAASVSQQRDVLDDARAEPVVVELVAQAAIQLARTRGATPGRACTRVIALRADAATTRA